MLAQHLRVVGAHSAARAARQAHADEETGQAITTLRLTAHNLRDVVKRFWRIHAVTVRPVRYKRIYYGGHSNSLSGMYRYTTKLNKLRSKLNRNETDRDRNRIKTKQNHKKFLGKE